MYVLDGTFARLLTRTRGEKNKQTADFFPDTK